MAEEIEGQESGAQATGIDPAAIALALSSASRAKADAFLDEQRALAADQRHHLRRQYTQLGLSIWQTWLGVLLRLATAAVGLTVAVGLAFLVWDASRSGGLLVEPFAVPPDLATRGLTGQVVAAKLLDRLVAMQAQTNSQRASKSYANSWDERGIKLDIPETGVSLAELDNFLRGKLGHDTHVGGEIVRTSSGISLTVRAGRDRADTVSGVEADLDGLVQRSAESIYRMTQLYRYGVYLANHGRGAEARAAYSAQIYTGSAADRAWNYVGWGICSLDSDGAERDLALLRQAIALAPNQLLAWRNVGFLHTYQSRPELAIRDWNRSLSLLSRGVEDTVRAELIPLITKNTKAEADMLTGAFADAAAGQSEVVAARLTGGLNQSAELARAFAGAHDLAAARAALVSPVPAGGLSPGHAAFSLFYVGLLIAAGAGDWQGILSKAEAADVIYRQYPGIRSFNAVRVTPLMALAKARLGDIATGEAQIAATPANCYDCLIFRAHIAELRGQRGRADYWFARPVSDAPSIPFAYADWGSALAGRGDVDGAIAKFTEANRRGPHFADPLEMWGEALMLQKHPDTALAKFEEAEKYAPNWGRLHLKWGEALAAAGRRGEARAQYQKSSTLDLTPAEKTELARVSVHV